MLGRVLLLVLGALALGWWLYGRRARPLAKRSAGSMPEAVVPCERCRLLVPAGAACADEEGRFFCSTEHAALGPVS
jgi:hypothetical protein